MATFLTEKMIFFHLPKTGGTWAEMAIQAAGVAITYPGALGDQPYSAHGHANLDDVAAGDRFSVAFVRHPLYWWRSYWGHRMRTGWRSDNGLDVAAASNDFNEFIVGVLEYREGYVSELVSQFVGTPVQKVDFVGRFEHLIDDLCTALRLGGESFSEAAIRAYPPQNNNDYDAFPAIYRPEVAAQLAEAEHETIERFYSDDPIPAAIVAGGQRDPKSSHGDLYRRSSTSERFRSVLEADSGPHTSLYANYPSQAIAAAVELERSQDNYNLPSKYGLLGKLARRLALRLLRPYSSREASLDRSILDALVDLDSRLSAVERSLISREAPHEKARPEFDGIDEAELGEPHLVDPTEARRR
ncbi:MAG: hypothetical protein WBV85_08395 [Solirubrobacteraceae bacterium]